MLSRCGVSCSNQKTTDRDGFSVHLTSLSPALFELRRTASDALVVCPAGRLSVPGIGQQFFCIGGVRRCADIDDTTGFGSVQRPQVRFLPDALTGKHIPARARRSRVTEANRRRERRLRNGDGWRECHIFCIGSSIVEPQDGQYGSE
jgi:hypothetical protein